MKITAESPGAMFFQVKIDGKVRNDVLEIDTDAKTYKHRLPAEGRKKMYKVDAQGMPINGESPYDVLDLLWEGDFPMPKIYEGVCQNPIRG